MFDYSNKYNAKEISMKKNCSKYSNKQISNIGQLSCIQKVYF